MIAYEKAKAGVVEPVSVGVAKTAPGTINDLVAQYYQSLRFTQKRPATQRNYKSVIEPFRAEYGEGKVAALQPQIIEAILAKVAARSTSSAFNLPKRLHMLMTYAIKLGFRTDNPMLLVDKVEHERKGYETWEEEDIAKFRAHWKIGTTQRLTFELLLHTGLRVSDAVRLGPQHLKKGVHTIVVQKTRKEVGIPLHVDLVPVLDAITEKHLTYLATAYGGRSRSSQRLTISLSTRRRMRTCRRTDQRMGFARPSVFGWRKRVAMPFASWPSPDTRALPKCRHTSRA